MTLDDGPFGILARHHRTTWSWPAHSLHVVAEVASGARYDKSGRRQQLLSLEDGDLPVIEVHSIMTDSPAARYLYEILRPRASSATKNLGEDASIAFCALQQPDAIFVTMDKGAAFLALAELGPGRVATPFDVWQNLLDKNLISGDEFAALSEMTFRDASLPGVPRRFNSAD